MLAVKKVKNNVLIIWWNNYLTYNILKHVTLVQILKVGLKSLETWLDYLSVSISDID